MRPVTVLVPDLAGLRLPGAELEVLRARLRQATSAPLVVARPEVAWGVPDVAAPLPAGSPDVDALVRLLPGSAVSASAVTARRARSRRARWRLSWGR